MAEDGSAPITRAELVEALAQLEERLMHRIDGRIDAAEIRILDAMRDQIAGLELRIQSGESSDALLTARLAIIERRLLRVERRLDPGSER